jgi:hypothetical protein
MIAGLALHIENTNIDGLVGDGVDVNIAGANVAELYMKNVSIRNCVGNGVILNASNASGLVAATLDHVTMNNCGDGFEATLRAIANLRNCVISTNNGASSAGVRVNGATSEVNVDACVVTFNTNGVRVDSGTARVAGSLVTNNSTALNNVGGTLKTYGTNRMDGNANAGAITPFSES